jgi:hypothetical protein
MQTNEPLADLIIVVTACALVALYVGAAGGGFPLDDSWIHQTYARNLALTGQWAFVPGVPSAASTSPLYTVMLTIGYWLGVPFQVWTHGLGAAALALCGLIGRRAGARAGAAFVPHLRGVGLATGLALVTAWHLIWAGAAGMETMIFSTLTLACIAWVWILIPDPAGKSWQGARLVHGAIFGVLGGLLTLARPEGGGLVALIGGAMLIARPNLTWRGVIGWGIAAGVAYLVTLAPYLAFNVSVTGGLLPNTAAAKQAWAAPVLALDFTWRLRLLIEPLLAGGQALLLPGAAAFIVVVTIRARQGHDARRHLALWLVPVVWSVALIILYAARLPLPFQHGRYVIPSLPTWIVVGVVGSAWLIRRASGAMIGRVLARTLVLSAAAVFALFAITVGLGAYRTDVAIIDQEMVTAAHWVRDHLPPVELLAVHDIGALGYFAPRPILDIAGLVSPEVIPIILDGDALWELMRQRDARYLMAMDDQVPNDDPSDPRLCPIFDTDGALAPVSGGSNIVVYRIAWDAQC